MQPSCMHDYALLLYALLVRCWNMNKKNGSQHHNNIKYRQVSNLILKNTSGNLCLQGTNGFRNFN